MAIRYPELKRYRGDDFVRVLTFKKNGIARDVTGFTFTLTVNSDEDPTTAANQVLQETGVPTDATNGIVSFTPVGDMDALTVTPAGADYYYDIEETHTASGRKRTIAKGKFKVLQDITK
ncbi:MAG: hypothetical protein R3337_00120 [Gammaproteobacteria bacterium]|nr:hypothetical protein [Gammaproteobacteria bacterium]